MPEHIRGTATGTFLPNAGLAERRLWLGYLLTWHCTIHNCPPSVITTTTTAISLASSNRTLLTSCPHLPKCRMHSFPWHHQCPSYNELDRRIICAFNLHEPRINCNYPATRKEADRVWRGEEIIEITKCGAFYPQLLLLWLFTRGWSKALISLIVGTFCSSTYDLKTLISFSYLESKSLS